MEDEKINEIAIWCDKIAYEHGLGIMWVINRLAKLKRHTGTIERAQEILERELVDKKIMEELK